MPLSVYDFPTSKSSLQSSLGLCLHDIGNLSHFVVEGSLHTVCSMYLIP